MSIEPVKYTRKTFDVDAIQVTAENVREVAEWCDGRIKSSDPESYNDNQFYIEISVQMAHGTKREKAFIGDWVTRTDKSFKAYRRDAFAFAFEMDDDGLSNRRAVTNMQTEVYLLIREALEDTSHLLVNKHETADKTARKIMDVTVGDHA